MPGHSKTAQRKRARAQERKNKTLAKKERRRKNKPNPSVNRIGKLLRRAFEKAGDMTVLRSPDEKTREHAYRLLKVDLLRLETTTGFHFVVLEDFSVMLFTTGEMDTREVHIYTHASGITKKR